MQARLRAATADDWDGIVALNNAEVPNVGPLTAELGEWYLANSFVTVGDDGNGIVAALVVMDDGSDYASPNYRWFAERHPVFAYVDRIVVDTGCKGLGLGRGLYEMAARAARERAKPVLTAEVNLEPRNDASLAFHARCGFVAVGEQIDPRYGTRVSMVELVL